MLNYGGGNLILSSLSSVHRRYHWQQGQIYHQRRWMSLSTAGISLTTAANLPPASLAPVANLPPVSPRSVQIWVTVWAPVSAAGFNDADGQFVASVVFIGGAPWVANIFAKVRKKFEKALTVLLAAREKMRFSDREIPNSARFHAVSCCQLSLLNSLPICL